VVFARNLPGAIGIAVQHFKVVAAMLLPVTVVFVMPICFRRTGPSRGRNCQGAYNSYSQYTRKQNSAQHIFLPCFSGLFLDLPEEQRPAEIGLRRSFISHRRLDRQPLITRITRIKNGRQFLYPCYPCNQWFGLSAANPGNDLNLTAVRAPFTLAKGTACRLSGQKSQQE
jgi:hypothetical protein